MPSIARTVALLAAVLVSTVAKADILHFAFTSTQNPAAGDFSFDLPSMPAPAYVDPKGLYVDTEVLSIEAGGQTFLSATHWFKNGFTFDSGDYAITGATPFSGPVSAPGFLIGSYTMWENAPASRGSGLLVVSNATTPELSSLWLLVTGVAALPAVRRLRA